MSETWWSGVRKGLSAPFDPHQVKFRIGSRNRDKTRGLALAYIDARDVMQRLDEVVGPENWQDQYQASAAYTGQVICSLALRMPRLLAREGNEVVLKDSEWIWKSDGAGATGMESEKGSLSDAFKRAAVKWGVGRYLYALESKWVGLSEGKYIPESELERLYKILGAGTIPEGALAEDISGMESESSTRIGSGRLPTKAQMEEIEARAADPKAPELSDLLVKLYNAPREAIGSREDALTWVRENVRQGAVEGLLRALRGEVPGGDFEF